MTDYISDDQLKHAVINAQKQLEYEHAMAQAGQRLGDIPGQVARDAVVNTAGVTVGTVAVTAGMIASRKFRYVVQVILHFPMSFAVLFVTSTLVLWKTVYKEYSDGSKLEEFILTGFIIAFIGAIIWTTAYVSLRTRVKWRKLKGEAEKTSLRSYRPQQQYGSPQYYPQYPQNQRYR